MDIKIMTVIFVLCIFLIIIYILKPISKTDIPKKIWTYWHDENNIPPLVNNCINTWIKFNSDYEITILNVKKIKELCGIDLNKLNIKYDFNARKADFARLFIIAKYGGIWFDSTIICTKSLDWVNKIQNENNPDYIGYYASQHTTDKMNPVPENWFFAAKPYSPFIIDWLKEAIFMNSAFLKEEDYIDFIKNQGYDLQNLENNLPYLSLYLCATIILQKGTKYNLYLMDAMEGPLKYLKESNWDPSESIKILCNIKSSDYPILKLIGTQREYLNNNNNIIKCETFSITSPLRFDN